MASAAPGEEADRQVKLTEWTLNPEHVRPWSTACTVWSTKAAPALRAALPHIEVCGKTGTAQLASNEFLKGGSAGKDMKDNAWFVGFAPRDNPEIVVVALFEHGGHGQFAAAIVRDVVKAYFDKKERVTQLEQTKARTVAALTLGLTPGTPR